MPIVYKPTCTFCAKSGLDIPTDHWLTNKRTGELTCPRLRATKCKCCGGTGHTVKMCSVRIELEQQEKLAQRKQRQADLASGEVWMAPIKVKAKPAPAKVAGTTKVCVPSSRFAALLCEEAELEEEIEQLETKLETTPAPPLVTWAAAVKRAQAIKWGATPLEAAKRTISWDASIPHTRRTIRSVRIMTNACGTAPAQLTPEQHAEWYPGEAVVGVPIARGYTPLKWTTVWGSDEEDEDEELPSIHAVRERLGVMTN